MRWNRKTQHLLVTLTLAAFGSTVPSAGTSQQDAAVALSLPRPWGPNGVGVRTFLVTDSTRPDTVSLDPNDFRPILVRVWYPAGEVESAPRRYMDPRTANAWRNNMPAADGFEDGITTHAHTDAPVSADQRRWPVLLFSPGRSFPVENYQITLEYLASMGWVVAAISPPYEEALTVLPDGRELPFSGPQWKTEDQRGAVLMGVVDDMVLDASRVLDRLETMNGEPEDPFGGRLGLDRGVGYLGHSLGGAAAAWTLQREPRVKAAVSWEGQVYRDADRPMKVTGGSLLYIVGGANRTALTGTQFRPGNPRVTVYTIVIHGAWHASFGDMLYIYRRYANRDWLARHRHELSAKRVNQITDDYVDEFFGHCLLGRPLDLLWPKSVAQGEDTRAWSYPEVELRVYGN